MSRHFVEETHIETLIKRNEGAAFVELPAASMLKILMEAKNSFIIERELSIALSALKKIAYTDESRGVKELHGLRALEALGEDAGDA